MVGSIPRTAVPIWSPSSLPSSTPLLATGTVSGALDASFSSDSLLELWDPFAPSPDSAFEGVETELAPVASLGVGSRFNRLAWGYVKSPERPKGVIAAGLENGEIGLWDPQVMLSQSEDEAADPLIARYDLHKGPVRGLDFNSHQTNLLASGATNGEIYIWDLTTPNKPFSPGARSRSIDDITTLAWNSHVVHVLATGSNSGYTVVWDLKSKREVTALSYAAGAPTGVGNSFGQPGWGAGGKRGVSAVQWHPDNPTKLVTASDDDHNPIIMLWDLRNWKEPEKILTGHEKGILSLSWCTKDADLLLSSGKDGRTIAWNPSSGDIVAEVTPSSNWSFDTQWCPRNPSILSTASLDGKISLHSIQSTGAHAAAPSSASTSLAPGADGSNIFDEAISANAANYPTKSLVQPPKWLRRPASVAFGFGGKLVCVSNAPSTTPGGPMVPSVTVRKVIGEPEVVKRALRLEEASSGGLLAQFCEQRSVEVDQATDMKDEVKEGEVASWKLLGTLFGAQSKGELVELLGFDKNDVKAKVEEVTKALKDKLPAAAQSAAVTDMAKTQSSSAISGLSTGSDLGDDSTSIAREPLVTFADTPTDGLSASSEGGEGAAANHNRTGSVAGTEVDESATSTSIASEGTKLASASEAESEVTEPSLFGDDTVVLTPSTQQQAAADFYSQIGSGRPAALPDHVFQRDGAANSSVAATVGSASSVASLNVRPATFKIYRKDESDVDRIITKALVLGDFDSAVALALSTDRFADAILLAVRGGPELLARTQKTYFERQTGSAPYLRVLQSIVGNDLADVVQNANLAQWQEIFVVLCTFATAEEFPALAEQLGQRLEYQYEVAKSSPSAELAPELRKNAILCYLAAGKLEKVVGIWIQQMKEDEEATRVKEEGGVGAGGVQLATSKYEAHARALQGFVEKVSVFQQAVGYVDVDLAEATKSTVVADSGARTYKLAELYARYVEYAELLAAQGLVEIALKYIAQAPSDFGGRTETSGPALTRDRLVRAAGSRTATNVFAQASKIAAPAAPVASTSQAQASSSSSYAPAKSAYPAYPPANHYPQQQQYPVPNAYPTQQQYPAPSVQQSPYGQDNLDDPYGPPASNPYAPKQQGGSSNYQPPQQSHNPYAPSYPDQSQTGYPQAQDPYNTTASSGFVPPPPGIRESSPNFASRAPPPAAVAPPPRSKPDQQWNDAPQLQRKHTPASAPKVAAITSPFPNSSPSMPASAQFGYNQQPGQQVPPPPPSRGSNRTPAPVPPPPQGGRGYQQAPVPTMSPPPPAGYPSHPQHQRFPGPPPPPGPPRPPGQQGAYSPQFRGAPTPPPGQFRPPSVNAGRGPYQQQPQHPGRPNGPPGHNGAPRPGPPYGPPGAPRQGGPPSFSQPAPPPAQAPAPAPPKPEPPKSKYPPGDTSHIPDASKPIFEILSAQLNALRALPPGPPQQTKMIADTGKKLSLLFDMLNCETLSPASHGRVLEICKAIEAHNKPAALDLHLQLLTSGAADVGSFQAAIKLIIQRMQ